VPPLRREPPSRCLRDPETVQRDPAPEAVLRVPGAVYDLRECSHPPSIEREIGRKHKLSVCLDAFFANPLARAREAGA
jgi:hypothetical protein